MDRKHIPTEIEMAVLTKSARRCALCFFLSRDLSEKRGQIAHLDQNPSNFAEDNLAFVCLDHHSLYDSTTRQHKNYTIAEVKGARADLYKAISQLVPGGTPAISTIANILPVLTRKANATLEVILRQLDSAAATEREALILRLRRQSALIGTENQEDIQFSVVDTEGIIVFHNWAGFIGQHVLTMNHVPAEFKEILSYEVGATAWCDAGANTSDTLAHPRFNLAIFATAPRLKWKVCVELHVSYSTYGQR